MSFFTESLLGKGLKFDQENLDKSQRYFEFINICLSSRYFQPVHSSSFGDWETIISQSFNESLSLKTEFESTSISAIEEVWIFGLH